MFLMRKALVGLFLMLLLTGVSWAGIVKFVPSASIINPTDVLVVDVVFERDVLDPEVVSYDIAVGYDASIVTLTGATAPGLSAPAPSFIFGSGTVPGAPVTPPPATADLGILGPTPAPDYVRLVEATIIAAPQATDVTLFTLTFVGLAPGTTALTFLPVLDGAISPLVGGFLTLGSIMTGAESGSITVTPEPVTWALVGFGLAAVGFARRRRARTKT